MPQELLSPTVRTVADTKGEAGASQPEPPAASRAPASHHADWKRTTFILLGAALFFAAYLAPEFAPAVDPQGQVFALSREGKAALGLFFLAATWWVTEVVPIGVTSIAIAVIQADDHIMKAVYEMVSRDLSLLPVLDGQRLVGVVRSVELFRELAEVLRQ